MEYGVYLDGEVMTTNEDYFKALEEAEYLTKDTGVVHWVMPIKEEAKWDEQRVNAYKRYVKNYEEDMDDYERRIAEHQKGLRSMTEMVCSVREKRIKTLEELYKQGWLLDGDKWVEVDKQ